MACARRGSSVYPYSCRRLDERAFSKFGDQCKIKMMNQMRLNEKCRILISHPCPLAPLALWDSSAGLIVSPYRRQKGVTGSRKVGRVTLKVTWLREPGLKGNLHRNVQVQLGLLEFINAFLVQELAAWNISISHICIKNIDN